MSENSPYPSFRDKDSEIKDNSSLHKYRTEIPDLIFSLGLDPFEFSAYCSLKRIHDEGDSFGKTISDLIYENINVAESKLRKTLDGLLKKELIEEFFLTDSQVVEFLKLKSPQYFQISEKICEWCSCVTCLLQNHHHPIKKSEGGEFCIKICANCHYEFHYLVDSARYRMKEVV
jgi:hypothetical protein